VRGPIESGLNTKSALSLINLLLLPRKSAVAMVSGLRTLLLGLFAPASSVRRPISVRFWSRGMGSIDEPLGSPEGVPIWIVTLLILLFVAAVIVLAVVFLVPPGPPPYT
jgi:hypothetical protein